jgi:nucleoside 2-deoxyribosyltransferase
MSETEKQNGTVQKDMDLFAFVLMPFHPEFDDVYKLGIKETAAECGILAERVDEQLYRENILAQIYRQIDAADLIVADMSGQNPNVFYEVGYAHAKGKLCILMTKDASHIPFDLALHRHIIYGSSITGLKTKLREELDWARTEITKLRSCGMEVKLKDTVSELTKEKMYATGTIWFQIDLVKKTSDPPIELHALYFYTGKGWTLHQEGRECAVTDSDMPEFDVQHMLTSPVAHFRRNTWAQVKFTADKMLAWAAQGQELKDTYRCRGTVLVRLVTSQGTFDYPSLLDIEVSSTPF